MEAPLKDTGVNVSVELGTPLAQGVKTPRTGHERPLEHNTLDKSIPLWFLVYPQATVLTLNAIKPCGSVKESEDAG